MKKSRLKLSMTLLAVALIAALSLVVFAACGEQDVVEKCTVTFMNGSEVFETQSVTLGERYTLPQNIPTREQPDDEHEMQFVGWTLDSNYYEYRSEIISEPDFVVADIVIYAAFRVVEIDSGSGQGANKEYEVEFRMPVGEDFGEWSGVTIATQYVKRYQNAVLPKEEDMPDIDGYHFTGEWTGGTLTDVRGRRRVTAVYEKNVYTLVLHYLDKIERRETEYHAPIDLSQTPQTDDVFVFEGWYADDKFQTQATLTEMPDGDVDIYAKYHIDFSTASVSREGTMVYGDTDNKLYVSGLKDCEGMVYTFAWTVNGQSDAASSDRERAVKAVGTYNVKLHIYANYKNGVLTDEADAKTENNATEFVFNVSKATLTAVVTLATDSVVYGDSAPAASIVYSGFVFDETQQSVGITQQFLCKQGDRDVTGTDLHVGTYTVETIPQEHPNYTFVEIETKQFSVTKRDLTVTAAVSNFVYGTPLDFNITFNGFVFEDGEDDLGEHWFTLDGQGKYVGGERIHVGEYAAQLYGYDSNDYNVKLPTAVKFKVSKRSGSARLVAEGGLYGVSPKISVIFSNILADDEDRFVPTYAYTRGGNAYNATDRFVVGEYFVSASFAEQNFADYDTLTVAGAEFSIAKKPVKVNVDLKKSYVYGEAVTPSLSYEDAFAFDESENTPDLVKGNVSYKYCKASDGTEYILTQFNVDDYTVTAAGLSADNYSFEFPETKFSVTKKDLTLTVHLAENSIVYGLTPQVKAGDGLFGGISYDGFVYGETVRGVFVDNLPKVYYLDGDNEVATQFHAGTYTATTSADAKNYRILVNTASLTVTRRALSVDIQLPSSELVYGKKPNSTKIVYVGGFVSSDEELYTADAYVEYAGKQTYTQAQLAQADTKMVVDTYKVSVKGISSDIDNDYDVTYAYLAAQNELTFAITPAALTVNLTSNTASYVYGTQPKVTATYSGFAYGETAQDLFGESANKILYRSSSTKTWADHLDVGEYDATLNGIQNENYTVKINERHLTVTPKTLTVTISAAGFTYGDKEKPELTLSYSGFEYDESDSVVKGTPSYAYKRGAGINDAKTDYTRSFFDAGYYTVTVSGLKADNYIFDYGSGKNFTVARRNFTATPSVTSITYGDAPEFTFDTDVLERDKAGFEFGFDVKYRVGNNGEYTAYEAAKYTHYQAGNYQVVLTYTLNSNYYPLMGAPSTTFTVGKKQLTVTVTADDFTYGGTASPKVTSEGLVSGDENLLEHPTFLYDGTSSSGTLHAGAHTVTVQKPVLSNYTINIIPGNFNVGKASVTVKVNADGYTYGDKEKPEPSLEYGEFVNGDNSSALGTIGFTYKRSATEDGNKEDYADKGRFKAGYYTIGIDKLTSADYDIILTTADIVIKKAALTVEVSVVGFQYDGKTVPAPSLTYSGFITKEDKGVLGGNVAYAYDGNVRDGVYHAGKYTVTPSGYTSENYEITYTQGNFTVTPREVSITLAEGWTTYADDPTEGYKWYTLGGQSILDGDKLDFDVAITKGSDSYTQGSEPYFSVGTYTVTVTRGENSDYVVKHDGEEVTNSTAMSFTVNKAKLVVSVTGSRSIHWQSSATWAGTPTIGDNRFEIKGKLGMTEGEHEAATYSLKEQPLDDKFCWREPCHITAKGTDVTDNFDLVYTVTLTLSTSHFVVTVPDRSIVYDAKEHVLAVSATADGIEDKDITYTYIVGENRSSEAPKYTDVGTYTVKYEISAPNTDTGTGEFTVEITKADYTEISVDASQSYNYDAGSHGTGVTFKGVEAEETPDGAVVKYAWGEQSDLESAPQFTNYNDGGYTVTYTISGNSNYNDKEGTYKVTINKADITVEKQADVTEFFAPDTDRFHTVSPEDIKGVDGNKLEATVTYGTSKGTYASELPKLVNVADSGTVYFKVSANDNYNDYEGSYTVTINKVNYNVTANDQTFTYNGAAQGNAITVEGIENDTGFSYTVTYNGGEANRVAQFTNYQAGGHTVNYKISGNSNYNDKEGTYKVTINKADITVKGQAAISGTYAPGQNHFNAVSVEDITGVEGDTNFKSAIVVKYGRSEADCNSASLSLVNVADSGTVYFKVSAGSNYNEASGSYTVTIAKATVTIPTIEHKTYNKSLQTAEITTTELFRVNKNEGGTTVSSEGYDVEIELIDAANYKWSDDDETAVKTLKFYIDKAKVERPTENKNTFTYNATKQTYHPDNFDDRTMAISDNEQANAGEHKVKVWLSDKNNYEWSNGGDEDISFTFNIGKSTDATIDVRDITTEYTYTGAEQTIKEGAVAKGIGEDKTGLGTISYSDNTFKDVPEGGTFVLTITLGEGDNYLGTSTTIAITVKKADYKVTANDQAFTYNGAAQGNAITVEGIENDTEFSCTVTYNGGEANQVAQFTDYQKDGYTVNYTISGNSNYNDKTGTYTVTINKADITVTGVDNVSKTYDGQDGFKSITKDNAKVQGLFNNEDITVTYSQNKEGVYGGAWTIKDATNSGAITVYFKVSAGNNYNEASGSYTVTIDPQQLTVTLPEYTGLSYDGSTSSGEVKLLRAGKPLGSIPSGITIQYSYNANGSYTGMNKSTTAPDFCNAVTGLNVQVNIESDGNYTFLQGEDEYKASQTYTYTVNIAKATLKVVATDGQALQTTYTHTYNKQDHFVGLKVNGLYGADEASIKYTSNNNDEYKAEAFAIINAGTYTVYYKITAGDNYNEASGSYTVNIGKADYDISKVVKVTGTYNKSLQGYTLEALKALIKTYDGDTFNVAFDGDGQYADADTYTITYKISGNDNYNDKTGTYTLTIAKAKIDAPTDGKKTFEYNKAQQTYTPEGFDSETMDITDNVAMNANKAGEHYTASVTPKKNYEWRDGGTNAIKYTFVINKKVLNKPTADTDTFTYTGEAQTYIPEGFDHDTMNIIGNVQTDANWEKPYTVTVSLKDTDNYAWNENSGKTEFEFVIHRAARKVDNLPKIPEQVLKLGICETLSQVYIDRFGLPDGMAWKDGTTKLVAGTHDYDVTIKGDSNFLNYEGKISITARKQRITVQLNDVKGIDVPFEGTTIDFETLKDRFTTGDLGYTLLNEDGIPLSEEELKYVQNLNGPVLSCDQTIDKGGTYKVTYSYTIGENDYFESAAGGVEGYTWLKVKSVDVGGTLYTIEDALNIAQSGQTVLVKYNTSFATAEMAELAGYKGDSYYTVKSGVTLLLPYDGGTGVNTTTTSGKTPAFNNPTSFKKLELTIGENITLYNNGTISIGGITTGQQGGYSGCTAGDYAQITMGKNAIISSTGDINAYGYIAETVENNGSQVIMNSGTLLMPFIVREHRGGTQFSEMVGGLGAAIGGNPSKNLKTSPFNTFYLDNVHAKLILVSGSKLKGHANLYASSKDNTTDIALVGTSESLLNMSTGSKLIAKYSTSTGVTKLEMQGNLTMNALSLKLSVVLTVTLSTEYVYFPISWRYDITLSAYEDGREATFDTTAQKIKLLPGAKFTVSKGATLNASELVVYDEHAIDFKDPSQDYEKKAEGATLIVNGTLSAQKLAGLVQTEGDGAVIKIDGNTIATEELTANPSTYKSITSTLKGKKDGDSTVTDMSAGMYVSNGSSWIMATNSISYSIRWYKNDGTDAGGTLSDAQTAFSNTDKATIYSVDLDAPERAYYEFTGWYTDQACTKLLSDDPLSVSNGGVIELYAGWKAREYDIEYIVDFAGEYPVYINKNAATWHIGENIILENATYIRNVEGFTFKGWFADARYNATLQNISDDTVAQLMHDGKIVVYGYFENANKEYDVVYDAVGISGYTDLQEKMPMGDIKIKIGETLGENFPSVDMTVNDYDINKQYYFGGWEANGKPIDENTQIDATYLTNGTLVLKAKWLDKVTLTVTVSATGKKGGSGWGAQDGASVTANVKITSSQSAKSEEFSVTGEGGKGGFLGGSNATPNSRSENYYLKPGQDYTVDVETNGSADKPNESGTAGDSNITVEISAT